MPGIVALTLLEGKKRFNGSLTKAVAILTLSFSVGQMVGPIVAGWVIDASGNYFFAMQISQITLILSGLFMINPERFLNMRTK